MGKLFVCAVDGSKAADRAAACAVDLARAGGARLCFLNINVVPTRSRKTYFWDATLVGAAKAQSHRQLAAAAKMAKTAKFGNFDCVIASGSNVADAIVSYVAKHKADHLVVGTGTSNELARLFLGSVATAVVSHAACPVTVVKAR